MNLVRTFNAIRAAYRLIVRSIVPVRFAAQLALTEFLCILTHIFLRKFAHNYALALSVKLNLIEIEIFSEIFPNRLLTFSL